MTYRALSVKEDVNGEIEIKDLASTDKEDLDDNTAVQSFHDKYISDIGNIIIETTMSEDPNEMDLMKLYRLRIVAIYLKMDHWDEPGWFFFEDIEYHVSDYEEYYTENKFAYSIVNISGTEKEGIGYLSKSHEHAFQAAYDYNISKGDILIAFDRKSKNLKNNSILGFYKGKKTDTDGLPCKHIWFLPNYDNMIYPKNQIN